MTAQNVAFWILAIAMAGAAIGVVRSQNVVHAANPRPASGTTRRRKS